MHTALTITGMHCASCKALLEDIIGEQPGVTAVTVDRESGSASIEHDTPLDWEALAKEVEGAGPYRINPFV